MNIEIIINPADKDKVKVKNVGSKDYLNTKHTIKAGEEIELPTNLAKLMFGDWENETHGEKKRQISLNIHLIQVKIRTELPVLARRSEVVNQTPQHRKMEQEFSVLEKLNPPEEDSIVIEKKLPQCDGKTKAGKRCKREALPGDIYCAGHKE